MASLKAGQVFSNKNGRYMSWRLSYDISTSIHTFASWSVSDTCCSPVCPHPGKKVRNPLVLSGIMHIPPTSTLLGYFSLLTEKRNIDDHHRNPNINDRYHQVGQLTYPHPPYTKAALPTEKLSPSPGRQAGGYLDRFTRSSVMKWTFKMKKREVHFRVL